MQRTILAAPVAVPALMSAQEPQHSAAAEVERVFFHMRFTAMEGDRHHFALHLPEAFQSDQQLNALMSAPYPWRQDSEITSAPRVNVFTPDSVGLAVDFDASGSGSFSGVYVKRDHKWILACWVQALPARELVPGCERPDLSDDNHSP